MAPRRKPNSYEIKRVLKVFCIFMFRMITPEYTKKEIKEWKIQLHLGWKGGGV